METKRHHYIRSVQPEGLIGLNGTLRSGDELLQVNDTVLLGQFIAAWRLLPGVCYLLLPGANMWCKSLSWFVDMSHRDVVATLKELTADVCLICARLKQVNAEPPAGSRPPPYTLADREGMDRTSQSRSEEALHSAAHDLDRYQLPEKSV